MSQRVDNLESIKMILRPLAEGVVLIDPHNFTILHTNPMLESILLYREYELIGKPIDEIFPISTDIHDILNILEDNEYLTKISWQLQNKFGEPVDIDFSIQYLKPDENPENGMILLYIRDRTEQVKLTRMLVFTQNLLRAVREIKQSLLLNQDPQEIIESACISLKKARGYNIVWGIFLDENGNEEIFLLAENPGKTIQIKHKLKELIKKDRTLVPIYQVTESPYSLMNFYSSGKDLQFSEFYSLFKDARRVEGLSFQISWNERIYGAIELIYFKEYIFAEDDIHILQELGSDLGFTIYSKKTEKIKREALQKIEYQGILLDTIDVPILSLDQRGRVQYANYAAEKRLNYSFMEMKDQSASEILGFTHTTLDFIRTRTIKREILVKNPRIREFPALLHSSPIMGRNNQFLGIMVVIFDITDRKEQEIQNRNLDRLLIESAKFVSIGELAAGIAHEINNPLQSALLYLEDLIQVDEEDPKERKKILQTIEAANKRIMNLVKNLLDLGRTPATEKDWISPELLLERVLDLVEANCRKKNIKLEKHIEEELPKIYVRWQEIEQVIINCIINSINAISEMPNPPAHPVIRVIVGQRIIQDQKCIYFRIEDNGPGLNADLMEKVFLPLFTTRRDKHGTGLGLAISKKIVTDHGGTIGFDPDFRDGSCIQFSIPIN